jgi:hypothetical protein
MRPDYRLFSCPRCHTLVAICSHCDRGQVYCDRSCSAAARSQGQRESGQRYQATERGRRLHAARQARYLIRRQAKMTHQGTPAVPASCKLSASALAKPRGPRGWVMGPEWVLCSVCGSRCRPYGRWTFLRRRRR